MLFVRLRLESVIGRPDGSAGANIRRMWRKGRTVRIASGQVDTPPRIALLALAIHTFTVGVIGTAIIATITRTARGHTGRELVAGKVEVACYGLFILATLVRVLGPGSRRSSRWPGYTHPVYAGRPRWFSIACDTERGLSSPVSMASRVEERVLLEAASKRDPS
ncbi:NnrS family protein [Paraburkholderia youngii]|uniref:NnrS family protein n=1 Tax=Paraburkholderia youngii TaxID=2782701 RepID=UPI001FEAD94B|nr:NnrS family protein [Paraburkholderia youngii]